MQISMMVWSRTFMVIPLLALANPACAQDADHRYVPIPFQGDFESLFKFRLQAAQNEPLRRLLEKMQMRGQFDPSFLRESGLLRSLENDPALRQLMQKMASPPDKRGSFPPKMLDDFRKNMAQSERPSRPPPPPGETRRPEQPPSNKSWSLSRSRPERARSDLMTQWMRDLSRQAEDTELGDWFRDSPAFQKGLTELKSVLDAQANPWRLNLDSLPEGMSVPERWFPARFGEKLLDSIKNFQMPDMSRLHMPNINLPRVSLPQVNLPHVNVGRWGVPPLPSFGAPGAGLGQALLWLLLVIVVLIAALQFARNYQKRIRTASRRHARGPWPVDPAKIMTRAELIKAFDYLALLRLGEQARTWNHRTVEQRLLFGPGPAATATIELPEYASLPLPAVAASPEQSDAVAELTRLYENARYTVGPEVLTASDQAAARRHIVLLTDTAR